MSYGYGYPCSTCGAWVYNNLAHSCDSTSLLCWEPTTFTFPQLDSGEVGALKERVAELEAEVERLKRRTRPRPSRG